MDSSAPTILPSMLSKFIVKFVLYLSTSMICHLKRTKINKKAEFGPFKKLSRNLITDLSIATTKVLLNPDSGRHGPDLFSLKVVKSNVLSR